MKAVKEVPQAAFLLLLHRLTETHIILQTLRILKNSTSLNYETGDINSSELKTLFPGLPKQAQQLLREFGREAIDFTKREIKQRHTKQKAGVVFASYLRNALLRHYHQLLESIKPFAPLVKWYHTKQVNGNKHFSTAPCKFSSFRPQLKFELVKKGEELQLITHIDINGTAYIYETFTRQHFLLESSNEYFILSYQDYQKLEWLQQQKTQQYAARPTELAQHILEELEKDYPVNRNNLLGLQQIESKPVNRVMLSELSNAFLMLTPQWLYEGFLVEGPWKETADFVQQGEAFEVKRNKEQEQIFLQLLESLHPDFSRQSNGYYYLSFAEAQKKQWFLKTYHRLLVLDIELLGMDMLKHFRYSPFKAETEAKMTHEDERSITLLLVIKFGKEKIQLTELQKMLLAAQRAVLLKDGSLGVLGDEWLRQYATIIKHGKIHKDEITIARWMAIS